MNAPVGSGRFGLWKAFLFSVVLNRSMFLSVAQVHFEQKYIWGRNFVFCVEALLCFPTASLRAVTRQGRESSGGENLPAERTVRSPGPGRGTNQKSAFGIRQRGFKR